LAAVLPGLICAAGLIAACAADSTQEGGEDRAGAPRSEAACAQDCRDQWTAYGIVKSVWTEYEAHLLGNPEGQQADGGPCTLGGSVEITGTVAVSGSNQTNDLRYELWACGDSQFGSYDLGLTGSIAQSGTFVQDGAVISMTYTSAGVTFSGTVLDSTPVSGTCDISINEDSFGASGTICGRTFRY
jgi:hypothetical protein